MQSNYFAICFPPPSFCSAFLIPAKVYLTTIVVIKTTINRNFTHNPVKLQKASQSFRGQTKPRTE